MSLLNKIADEKKLTDAWERVYDGKSDDVREKSRGIDDESLADFKKNDKENIKEISKQLLNSTYSLQSLFGFTEPKKNGKFRLITAPCVRDRIVHAAILAVIQEFFPEIRNGSSYCLPRTKLKSERVNFIDAFRMLIKQVEKGNNYVFESDIESFFDRIIKKRLFEEVLTQLPDNSIDGLIEGIVYFEIGNIDDFKERIKQEKIKQPEPEIGLSQGSPLSPLFANIYLKKFDAGMRSQFGDKYIRYVDDFIVACSNDKETSQALEKAINLLKDDGLTLPPIDKGEESKTRTVDLLSGEWFVFLGIRVTREAIHPNASIQVLRHHLDSKCFVAKAITFQLRSKKIQPTNQAKEKVINARIQSKFGVFGYFHTTETVSTINEFIALKAKQSMLNIREIKIKKRGMPIITQKKWQSYFV